MRIQYPLICAWIERANGSLEGGANSYRQTAYQLDQGALTEVCGASDEGDLLANDAIPETLLPLLAVFFEEMRPVQKSSTEVLSNYIKDAQSDALPFKSFYASAQFRDLQLKGGALSHEFEIGGIRESRMVSPYQVWMLGRLSDAMTSSFDDESEVAVLKNMLSCFVEGPEILDLPERLKGCRLRKQFEQLFIRRTESVKDNAEMNV